MDQFWTLWDIFTLGTSRHSVEALSQVSVSPSPLWIPDDSWTEERRGRDAWSEQGWANGGMR